MIVDSKNDSSVGAELDEKSDAPDEKDIIDPAKELNENINPKEESKCDLNLIKTSSTGSNGLNMKLSELDLSSKQKKNKQTAIEDFFNKK
jgi:hypothetical protein